MSSSTSAEPIDMAIQRSLSTLARQHPAGYRELVALGDGLVVDITSDDVRCSVSFDRGSAAVVAAHSARSQVSVQASRRTIASVIDGTVMLAEAVWSDDLQVKGSIDAVNWALEVLHTYVQTAIHAPAQQSEHENFVASA